MYIEIYYMILPSPTLYNCSCHVTLWFVFSLTGVGDYQVSDVNFLPDPCSLPDAQKKRALNEKERLLYAPMAGVGGVVYDKDAVYVDLPASHVKQQEVGLSKL